MSEIKRITPGSKAALARRMADRRRELIARPLAEIWEELAAVAMDGSDRAPAASQPDATARLLNIANDLVAEAFMADWHDPDGTDKGVREIERIKKLFIEKLNRFACDEIKLHLARSAASTVEPAAAPTQAEIVKVIADKMPDYYFLSYAQYNDIADAVAALYAAPTTSPNAVVAENATTETSSPDIPDSSPEPDAVREAAEALCLLAAYDERLQKLHDLLETIREQIRTGVEPEHRPKGLFQNIQDAVYNMRGRTLLMNDAAIVGPLQAIADPRNDRGSPS